MSSPGQATLPYLVDICVQLTSGLRHLHACGVLHRDLKTDNALVQSLQPLVVKWADFGCSVKLKGGTTSATYGTGGCDTVTVVDDAAWLWLCLPACVCVGGGGVCVCVFV